MDLTIPSSFINWGGSLKIPAKPMTGTLGTAPLNEIDNGYGGGPGGNMDISEVTAGVYCEKGRRPGRRKTDSLFYKRR